jgi:hypothetical protein
MIDFEDLLKTFGDGAVEGILVGGSYRPRLGPPNGSC